MPQLAYPDLRPSRTLLLIAASSTNRVQHENISHSMAICPSCIGHGLQPQTIDSILSYPAINYLNSSPKQNLGSKRMTKTQEVPMQYVSMGRGTRTLIAARSACSMLMPVAFASFTLESNSPEVSFARGLRALCRARGGIGGCWAKAARCQAPLGAWSSTMQT